MEKMTNTTDLMKCRAWQAALRNLLQVNHCYWPIERYRDCMRDMDTFNSAVYALFNFWRDTYGPAHGCHGQDAIDVWHEVMAEEI